MGRIAQGFFAFHALGVYGDVATERLSHAKDTVWLVDSNVQIGLLALSSSSNALFRDCFNRLLDLKVRLFTTEKLFDEVHQHFYFPDKLIENDQIVLRYCNRNGSPAEGRYPENPNGSIYDIAGICDPTGIVFGLMPHPERAFYGWQLPDWTSLKELPVYADGKQIFKSMIDYFRNR